MTTKEILEATGGALIQGGGTTGFRGVSIDSRAVNKGDVFIAIRGKRLDGHRFVRKAVIQGAALVVVSRPVSCPKNVAVVSVKDTTIALGQIAASYRRRFNIPVVAVTGSAGKTTTKDMIAAVLSARFKVLKNIKTQNNQYGVSLTILGLKKSHQALVLEAGTNNPGEIRWIARIAQPTVVVLTNIGESHLQGLRSRGGVYREKSDLFRGMGPGGRVIFNNDDRYLKRIRLEKKRPRIISYGIREKADLRAGRVTVENNRKICFHVRGERFILNTPAEHYVYNALAAIACGRLLKVGYGDIRRALGNLKFEGRRQQVLNAGGVTVIDDTYNSNPVSLESAVKTIDGLKVVGKKIFVTADMLELGARSRPLHEDKGRMIARSTVDIAITVGKFSKYAAAALRQFNPRIKVFHYAQAGQAGRRLKTLCGPGDVVLVKGSRGMRMERVVESLRRHLTVKR